MRLGERGTFMSLVSRVRHSLAQQGLKRTTQTVASILADHWFDWRYGTDTVQEVQLDELDVPKPEIGALDYQASRTLYFQRLLQRVAAPPGSVFVDLGAGKCRTLLIAAQHGYRKAVGVEFSEDLCVTARRNVEIFRRKAALPTELRVVNADATQYPLEHNENVLYVTAFSERPLRRILDNVAASMKRAPRDLTFIAHNPFCPQVIESHAAFAKVEQFIFGSTTALIFKARAV